METVEEKANEFLDKNIVDLFGSPPDAAYNGFIAEAESELLEYEESLKGREDAIREVRQSIARQRRILYQQAREGKQGNLFDI